MLKTSQAKLDFKKICSDPSIIDVSYEAKKAVANFKKK